MLHSTSWVSRHYKVHTERWEELKRKRFPELLSTGDRGRPVEGGDSFL